MGEGISETVSLAGLDGVGVGETSGKKLSTGVAEILAARTLVSGRPKDTALPGTRADFAVSPAKFVVDA